MQRSCLPHVPFPARQPVKFSPNHPAVWIEMPAAASLDPQHAKDDKDSSTKSRKRPPGRVCRRKTPPYRVQIVCVRPSPHAFQLRVLLSNTGTTKIAHHPCPAPCRSLDHPSTILFLPCTSDCSFHFHYAWYIPPPYPQRTRLTEYPGRPRHTPTPNYHSNEPFPAPCPPCRIFHPIPFPDQPEPTVSEVSLAEANSNPEEGKKSASVEISEYPARCSHTLLYTDIMARIIGQSIRSPRNLRRQGARREYRYWRK